MDHTTRALPAFAGRSTAGRRASPEGLARDLLLKQPKAMQRRLLRLWLEQVRGNLRGIDFGHLTAILRLIGDGPPQGRLALPGGWEFTKEYGALVLHKPSDRRNRVCYAYEYRLGSALRISEAGVTLYSQSMSASAAEWPRTDMEAAFDLACLPDQLTVRNFRPGDRFCPLGMAGHKKLKDLFIDDKVPRSLRASWPLLSMGGEILWIPGFGRSEFGKIGLGTEQVWHFKAVLAGVE
jgi:tRNA(Ile)-lysidine synthase